MECQSGSGKMETDHRVEEEGHERTHRHKCRHHHHHHHHHHRHRRSEHGSEEDGSGRRRHRHRSHSRSHRHRHSEEGSERNHADGDLNFDAVSGSHKSSSVARSRHSGSHRSGSHHASSHVSSHSHKHSETSGISRSSKVSVVSKPKVDIFSNDKSPMEPVASPRPLTGRGPTKPSGMRQPLSMHAEERAPVSARPPIVKQTRIQDPPKPTDRRAQVKLQLETSAVQKGRKIGTLNNRVLRVVNNLGEIQDPEFGKPGSPKRGAFSPRDGVGGTSNSLAQAHGPTMVFNAPGAPKPAETGVFKKRKDVDETLFRKMYDRSDLPVSIQHGARRKIQWIMPIEEIDYETYLPVFFDGLREKTEPYNFISENGLSDLLEHGREKILPVVPLLIAPIREAMETKDPGTLCKLLRMMQKLVLSWVGVGEALVPYYRQILPMFNLFKSKTANIGDGIVYSQQKRQDVGELIQETLELMEIHGGKNALINIKYMIPTYEGVGAYKYES